MEQHQADMQAHRDEQAARQQADKDRISEELRRRFF
mgnify:CR=1 FL=1